MCALQVTIVLAIGTTGATSGQGHVQSFEQVLHGAFALMLKRSGAAYCPARRSAFVHSCALCTAGSVTANSHRQLCPAGRVLIAVNS